MKKLGLIILGFIIGVVLTYFFCPRQGSGNPIEHGYVAPKDTVSVKEAKVLSDNWAKCNATQIDSIIHVVGSRNVTRSVEWSLEEINEYLVYAKAKSDSLGYTMTGVRVYLGNYGDVKDPTKKNRNTMFIVPTGPRNTSKASSLNIALPPHDEDIPAPPLNNAAGGEGGYPN